MTSTQPGNNPLVSVIIPVYNGERYLSYTLESVIAQTEKNWEIISVNDGSTDHSQTILEEYAMNYPDHIRVIPVNNGGVSRARNTGVSEARGTYIAFLDQDDLWMPQKLQLQVEQFRSDKNLGISYTNESIIDHTGSVVREKVLIFNEKLNRGFVFEYLVFENFIPISSVMLKRDLFIAIGGFDPRYSLAEDYDFLLKAVKKASVDYIDAPLLLYREHKESGTHKKIDQIIHESFSVLHSWKSNDPWFFRKHFFHYFMFWLKFKILKLKVIIKKM
jgi:glycosyltransferase involved in cell wall biosynthesis